MSNIIKRVLKFIVSLLPVKHDLWVFGAWRGRLYGDNSKYLFEYISEHHKDIRAVWITRSKEEALRVRKLGYIVYTRFSFQGIWNIGRAEVAFETEGDQDISPLMNRKTIVTQLWHGMGMKAVGLEGGWIKNKQLNTEEAKKKYVSRYGEWIWLCASEEAKEKYHKSFYVPYDRFIITGEPKGDTFVNIPESKYIKELRENHPGARIAVYLPTHRNFGRDSKKADILSPQMLEKVNQQLAAINAVLIFKPHFHEFEKYKDYQWQLSNIIFAMDKEKFGDVYEFLPSCDMLITDYSGIMFGYLASGKPIIYFPYDKEEYIQGDAGFYYNYDDILYGPVCMTWEEVVKQISDISADDYKAERERQRSRFCPYVDGNSCERAYEAVKNLQSIKLS